MKKTCFGILIKKKRFCRNEAKFLYCGHHWKQPILFLVTLGTILIFTTDLFESLGLKKPIEYVNFWRQSSIVLNSKEIKQIIEANTSKLKIGIIEIQDSRGESNIYNRIYADKLNSAAKNDSLIIIAVPVNTSDKFIANETNIDKILEKTNLDIIIWGSTHQSKNCNESDLYCVKYKANESLINLPYDLEKTNQQFIEGNFNEFISGELSGDLNAIIYSSSILGLTLKNEFHKSLFVDSKADHSSNPQFYNYYRGYNLTQINRIKEAKNEYWKNVNNKYNSCTHYHWSTQSNLGFIYKIEGERDSTLFYNKMALESFEACSNNDKNRLPILTNHLASSYAAIGDLENYEKLNSRTMSLLREGIGYSQQIPYILSNMAVKSIESRDYQTAVDKCLLGLKFLGSNSDKIKVLLFHHLGMAYNGLGDYENSIKYYLDAREELSNTGRLYTRDAIQTIAEIGWLVVGSGSNELVDTIKTEMDSIYNSTQLNYQEKFSYYEFCGVYYSERQNQIEAGIAYYKKALEQAIKGKLRQSIIQTTYKNISGNYFKINNKEEGDKYLKFSKRKIDNTG